MTKFSARLVRRLQSFRDDCRGMEVLQSLLLVALAAIMLIGVNNYFQGDFKAGVTDKVSKVITEGSSTFGEAAKK